MSRRAHIAARAGRYAGAVDPTRALLPARLRWRALGLAVAALALLIGLGSALAGGSGPTGFDRAVRDWLTGRISAVTAQSFADFGSVGVVVPLIALAALGFAVRRWFRSLLLVVGAPVIAVVLADTVAKPLFDRTSGLGLAYPSGHIAAVSAMAFAVIVTAYGPARYVLSPVRSAIVGAASGLLVLAGMAGLVVAGYHYATDTIGGVALSLATVLLLALVIDAGADRLRRPRTPAGPRADAPAGPAGISSR